MSRNRLLLVVAVLAVIAGAWWYFHSGRENVAVDLIQQFPNAKQQPSKDVFTVADVKINNETKRSIVVQNVVGTRITWPITVPDNGWVKVAMGIKEEGWTVQGDGVLFIIGVSDHKTYDELLSLTVNPFGNAADRRWNEVSLDLSQYAGESVDLIFNSRSGPKGDVNGDFAVWGNPRVIIR